MIWYVIIGYVLMIVVTTHVLYGNMRATKPNVHYMNVLLAALFAGLVWWYFWLYSVLCHLDRMTDGKPRG